MKANTKFIEDELFFQSLIANILSDEMSESTLKSLIESKKEKKKQSFLFCENSSWKSHLFRLNFLL